MSGFSVTIDDTTVVAALGELSQRLGDMSEPLSEIGQMLVTEADQAFREQRDPWGNAWEELRPVTLARRRGPDAHILRDTGRLEASISYLADFTSVTVGTNVIYAAVHQFGNPNNRFYNTPKGARAPIPPRPFLPINASGQVALPTDTLDEILDILNDHLRQAMQ